MLGLRYSLGATLVTLAVAGIGSVLVAPAEVDGVVAGAGAGLLLQVVSFWVLAVWLFPTRRLMVVGLGMGLRMAVLLAAALAVPDTGLPLAPTLLTLVTVFVFTTLLEPIVFQLETKRAS
jgi:hypothetical protein